MSLKEVAGGSELIAAVPQSKPTVWLAFSGEVKRAWRRANREPADVPSDMSLQALLQVYDSSLYQLQLICGWHVFRRRGRLL